jgi:ubiquinone/menaquinone biosynthesis C-methylase UbiE
MPEMNPVSRFFVNSLTGRINRQRYRWLAENLRLPTAAACLEIGCGNGDLAARIVEGLSPARYVATDLDPHQIEVARRRLGRRYPQGLPAPLELREASMLALPFPAAAFDAVFAYVVLHHASPTHRDFTKVPVALAEIDRVLRPGGSVVYEEFLHKESIRSWFLERGYRVIAGTHHRSRETLMASKSQGITGMAPMNP